MRHAWEWDDEEEDGVKDFDEAAEDLDGGEDDEEDEMKGEEMNEKKRNFIQCGTDGAPKIIAWY